VNKKNKIKLVTIMTNIKLQRAAIASAFDAIIALESAKEEIEDMVEELQNEFDELSEKVQEGEKGQKFQDELSVLEKLSSSIYDAIEDLNTSLVDDVITSLEELTK
jgi:uncharacterized protein YukE